jgi:hypothetical protein
MDAREILGWLGRSPADAPAGVTAALRAAAAHGFDDVAKVLAMVLEVACDDPWILSPEEVWQLNHGLALFAVRRHRPALEPLLGYLSWDDEEAHALTGDFAAEEGARTLAAVSAGDGDRIAQACRQVGLRWYALDAMVSALGILVLEREWPRERLLAVVEDAFRDRYPNHSAHPGAAWTALGDLAASLHLHELRPLLLERCRSGDIDPGFLPEAAVEARLADPAAPAEFLAGHPPATDAAEFAGRWTATPGKRVPREIPAEAGAGPRSGRNEPCPCGSGKKFKRCCG